MTMTERGRWTVQRLELHPPGMGLRERMDGRTMAMLHREPDGWYVSFTALRRQYTLMHRSRGTK